MRRGGQGHLHPWPHERIGLRVGPVPGDLAGQLSHQGSNICSLPALGGHRSRWGHWGTQPALWGLSVLSPQHIKPNVGVTVYPSTKPRVGGDDGSAPPPGAPAWATVAPGPRLCPTDFGQVSLASAFPSVKWAEASLLDAPGCPG